MPCQPGGCVRDLPARGRKIFLEMLNKPHELRFRGLGIISGVFLPGTSRKTVSAKDLIEAVNPAVPIFPITDGSGAGQVSQGTVTSLYVPLQKATKRSLMIELLRATS